MHYDDIKQLYEDVTTTPPPEGLGHHMKGFEQVSTDGSYLLSFYMMLDGSIAIEVRPSYGSYAALETATYAEIEEASKAS